MNKEKFAQELKRLREQSEMSQEELADILSCSHRAFKGTNQVMLSQWERGKTVPSFVRRLGIANYFKVDYDFSVEEMTQVKAATKLMDHPINSDLAYDYEITEVKRFDLSELPEKKLKSIDKLHAKLYGKGFLDALKFLNVDTSKVEVLCFMSEGLMIGHTIYERETYLLLSIGALSVTLRREIFDYLSNLLGDIQCTFPVMDPAMGQFLYDLYLEPCCNQAGLMFFRSSIREVVENPFSQTIQTRHDIYFKYIRYYDLKLKKKSVDFTLM
ncbi:helix-turn-helix domain-containing protein [Vibrio sp. TBV020]|uniref:helix-turn-helix domain-containing protein n=1 Tax=Vibrio sp. TBV020 TaxID=3137398 RepID=UPI0038CDAFA5